MCSKKYNTTSQVENERIVFELQRKKDQEKEAEDERQRERVSKYFWHLLVLFRF